ncbi:outer membrane beta-barrel protein [Salinimicrobium tongyeongense]|uniref:Outer membrane beta-barrel protein n=1 Tax=Salinimicrobium tongyeongense TaxID=2809707 RepID=A0ABY6NT52_9FLAO|nr:CsgG/HfaB family protein [Salinimicrobium tongyeongense]UZH56087.1 outer membrane beta-barrel protein [Salinimicrobium tongyeongense]
MNKTYQVVLFLVISTLSSCGAYFNQPFSNDPARPGEKSTNSQLLTGLPPANDPVEVAVYNFSDQTGQYKAVENGSTFSTAVTQGATTILIKALEDSGWFIPIERENLSNLSTERNIIRNTKQEYIKNLNPNEPPLPALLYAGLILEGGIISYDTNILTGGIGARYFGLGGSAKYRQDRITVYLRAVSTNTGEILKTVYVSKTILSQGLDGSFFRFVKFQRLLEAETGITQNEPVQLAVQDAIEKAVRDLILEGIKDRLWAAQGGREVNQQLVDNYIAGKKEEEAMGLYDRLFVEDVPANNFNFSGGVSMMDGDYSNKEPGYFAQIGYQKSLFPHLSLGGNFNYISLDNGRQFKGEFAGIDINARFNFLPKDDFAPFVYGGPGFLMELGDPELAADEENLESNFLKFQYGGGLRYLFNSRVGAQIFAEHNIITNDKLDNFIHGKRDDHYFNFGLGLNIYF